MKYKAIICLFFWISCWVQAQEYTSVLERSFEFFKSTEAYTIDTKFGHYKGLESTQALESYSGYIMVEGNTYFQKLGPMEQLYVAPYFIKLNRKDQEILVVKYENFENKELDYTFDMETIAQNFKEGTMATENGFYHITLIGKPQNSIKVAKLEYFIDPDTYHIKKQVIVNQRVVDYSIYDTTLKTPDYDVSRIEIFYSNYTKSVLPETLKRNKYFSVKDGAIVLTQEFKDFDLVQ